MQQGHKTMETQKSEHSHLGGKLPENWPIQKFLILTNLASYLVMLQLLAAVDLLRKTNSIIAVIWFYYHYTNS